MSEVKHDKTLPQINRLGAELVAFALAAVVVAYPPPAMGVGPLFGIGNMFMPLILSVVGLLVASLGGVLIARDISKPQTDRSQRIALGILLPVSPVVVVSGYLVLIAGFNPQAPFIIGAVVIAIIGGLADKFLG